MLGAVATGATGSGRTILGGELQDCVGVVTGLFVIGE
jgi:hypothetical protein